MMEASLSVSGGKLTMSVNYDRIAEDYRRHRQPDLRIAALIRSHIAGARNVLNVGAGIGSYEPGDKWIVALEPSFEMISQRSRSNANLTRGVAEALPFRDNAFDLSMAILSIHHWPDVEAGLREMLRVTANRILLLTWIGYGGNFWFEDYLPEIGPVELERFPSLDDLDRILGRITVETVAIPYDCTDGFMGAYWRRPQAYLDPNARNAISTFALLSDIQNGLDRLKHDIESGAWRGKYGHLLDKESLDLGYRLVVHEKSEPACEETEEAFPTAGRRQKAAGAHAAEGNYCQKASRTCMTFLPDSFYLLSFEGG
jgi:SAM-dependent methyltransferase